MTQAGQGVMINYGSAPHISPLRSLWLTVSDYTPFVVCLQPVRGVLIDIQVGLRENSATLTSSHLESLISTVRNPYDTVGPTLGTTLMSVTKRVWSTFAESGNEAFGADAPLSNH